jgi:hypothetical protein
MAATVVDRTPRANRLVMSLATRLNQAVCPRLILPTRDMDVPLSALGEQQARALGRWIGEMPAAMQPNVVSCSPYVRARTTAELVVDAGWRNQRATRRLKGPTTYIVVPDGGHGATTAEIPAWRSPARAMCLPASSPVWQLAAHPSSRPRHGGVALHASAGERLAARAGPIGYLAREIGPRGQA